MAHLIARHSSGEPRRGVPEADSYRKPFKLLFEYEADEVLTSKRQSVLFNFKIYMKLYKDLACLIGFLLSLSSFISSVVVAFSV